jgi:uncharacterized membrane-anchored protein YjiN (DUF445 family)
LQPLLREWTGRLLRWAQSPESRAIIHRHLQEAAGAYRERGWFKKFTYNVAERFGGIDLEAAAEVLQTEVRRFATAQLESGSEVQQIIEDGLATIEERLHEDPAFLADVKAFLLETSEAGTLTVLLEPVLTSLRGQIRQELEKPDAALLEHALARIDAWLKQLSEDQKLREQVNAWCRRLATQLVEQHHSLVGALVEEQLNRLSDENLSKLIEAKVGEDLNWIRLNGSFVGGLVGVVLYLVLHLVGRLTGSPSGV